MPYPTITLTMQVHPDPRHLSVVAAVGVVVVLPLGVRVLTEDRQAFRPRHSMKPHPRAS